MSATDRFEEKQRYAAAADTATAPSRQAAGQQQPEESSRPGRSSWFGGGPGLLLQALVFGFAFGFLLQKGGVAKFDILVGVLLLEKFTVVKVMLSAIVVGMAGAYLLHRLNVLQLQVKETILGANLIGGLLFGVGFGLIAYCPGTDAAAVGQGNYDALVGILGMVFGSYLFALSSRGATAPSPPGADSAR